MLITADPRVLHGRVVELLDLVKQQGVDKIALLHKAGTPMGGTPKGGK